VILPASAGQWFSINRAPIPQFRRTILWPCPVSGRVLASYYRVSHLVSVSLMRFCLWPITASRPLPEAAAATICKPMSTKRKILIGFGLVVLLLALLGFWLTRGDVAENSVAEVSGTDPVLKANPDAETIPTVSIAEPVGWANGEAPLGANGLSVSRFAEGLDHPRTMITLPNGDVLVAQTNAPAGTMGAGLTGKVANYLMDKAGAGGASPNTLVLLRDADGDGKAEQRAILRSDLNSPSGLAYRDGKLFVANHDALLAFDYELGSLTLAGTPKKLMDLPAGGNHWMRNIALSPDGKQLYIAVGSASNIGENGMEAEKGRAAIWEYDLDDNSRRQFANGLRNPNGLGFSPATGELWTTVNERDMLGSDLVPDYLTNVPVGAQYGWPWVYWRGIEDERVETLMPEFLMEYTRKPEYALGPHVAALGLVFTGEGHRMGEGFANGAFIARHGSWNRRPLAGYDVVFVKFDERGNPLDKPVPVLTGFLTGEGTTHGRPTWLSWAKDGALLVSDDTAGIIWRVWSPTAKPAPKPVAVKSTPLPAPRNLTGAPTASFKDDRIEID
jgi:glucose/arabinose dehydrogenase